MGWCRAAAIQTLVTVFTAMDPVAKRWWQCVDPDDKVCRAALASLKPDVCGLPREAWQWTRRSVLALLPLKPLLAFKCFGRPARASCLLVGTPRRSRTTAESSCVVVHQLTCAACHCNRQRSVISEFDLVCDMSWAPQAVNSCYFIGFLIGAGLWGMVSDRIGEQKFSRQQASLVAPCRLHFGRRLEACRCRLGDLFC